jgi:hypothetical protein
MTEDNESTEPLCPVCDLKYVTRDFGSPCAEGITGWDEERIHPTTQAMGRLKVNGVAGRIPDGVRMPGP